MKKLRISSRIYTNRCCNAGDEIASSGKIVRFKSPRQGATAPQSDFSFFDEVRILSVRRGQRATLSPPLTTQSRDSRSLVRLHGRIRITALAMAPGSSEQRAQLALVTIETRDVQNRCTRERMVKDR